MISRFKRRGWQLIEKTVYPGTGIRGEIWKICQGRYIHISSGGHYRLLPLVWIHKYEERG